MANRSKIRPLGQSIAPAIGAPDTANPLVVPRHIASTLAHGGPLDLPDLAHRKGHFFEHKGARLFYNLTGRGFPLLLVHGYALSGALFARVLEQLSEHHTVITPDLRGFGKSYAPGLTGSVDVYAEDLLALLNKLGVERAIIAGMSMGGPTVLSMYAKEPDRFAGLMLIDTNAAMASPAEASEWRGVAKMADETGTDDIIPWALPVLLTGRTRMNDRALVEYVTRMIQTSSRTGLLSGAKALEARVDATALLGTIAVPTLVVVGQEDAFCSFEISQMMAQAIENAELHVVPAGAHAAIIEVPHATGNAIADWMAGISGAF